MAKVDGGGERYNKGKLRVDLLPSSFLEAAGSIAYTLGKPEERRVLAPLFEALTLLDKWGNDSNSQVSLGGILTLIVNVFEAYENNETFTAYEGKVGDLMVGVARVLEKGAEKYADRNWERGMAWSKCYVCAMRHIIATIRASSPEERLDKESGIHHLYHAACNIAFLLEYSRTCPDLDDRPFNGEESYDPR